MRLSQYSVGEGIEGGGEIRGKLRVDSADSIVLCNAETSNMSFDLSGLGGFDFSRAKLEAISAFQHTALYNQTNAYRTRSAMGLDARRLCPVSPPSGHLQ